MLPLICLPRELPGGASGQAFKDFLQTHARLQTYAFEELSEQKFFELTKTGADLLIFPAAFAIKTAWIAPDFQGCLASPSTGTDHVNLLELEERKIRFLHAPGMNADSVAEYVTGILACFFPNLADLRAEKIGIIGYGRIGRRLGAILNELGVSWKYYDPFLDESPPGSLSDCSIISFHVPLSRTGPHATFEMVTEEYLSRIAALRIIINTARGSIFRAETLAYAMKRYRIALDVFPDEPPPPEFIREAAFASPHVAGYNASARWQGLLSVLDQFFQLRQTNLALPASIQATTAFTAFTAPALEDKLLKARPHCFRDRRANYPERGDIFHQDTSDLTDGKIEYVHAIQNALR